MANAARSSGSTPGSRPVEPPASPLLLYHENLEHKIYERLKAMILDKALRPGERLQLARLGKDMGVSRTPLVNALKRLSAERLVEWTPRYGIYVRRFSAQEMVELYEVRVALESLAARLAAKRITDADIDRLEAMFRGVTISDTPEAARRYTPLDREFHWRIVELSGNSQLAAALQSIHMQIFAYQDGIARTVRESVPEHLEFLRALRARDAGTCERLMRKHHSRAVERLRQRVKAETRAHAEEPAPQ